MKKIIALLCLLSFSARADGLKYIPQWSQCGTHACYTFIQAKELVRLDSDMVLIYSKLDLQTSIILDLRRANTNLSSAVTLLESDVKLLKQNNDQLVLDLKQAVTEKNEAVAAKSDVSAAWLVTGVAVCVAAGLAVGFALHK